MMQPEMWTLNACKMTEEHKLSILSKYKSNIADLHNVEISHT